MATRAAYPGIKQGDERFFLIAARVMALILLAGFVAQIVSGRSSFHVPLIVHIHALSFFGWTAFYVLQTSLAVDGSLALHRRLGWFGAGWTLWMCVSGIAITVALARRGGTPFVLEPLKFLVLNILAVLVFADLTIAGVVMRRRTDWHRRLIFCGMAVMTGPGLGRVLPTPHAIPYVDWVVFSAVVAFPAAGIICDRRRTGKDHPAWWVGIGATLAFHIVTVLFCASASGTAFYDWITAGSPGAQVAPMAFPPKPPWFS